MVSTASTVNPGRLPSARSEWIKSCSMENCRRRLQCSASLLAHRNLLADPLSLWTPPLNGRPEIPGELTKSKTLSSQTTKDDRLSYKWHN
jgi:hypothetical protein